MGLSYSYISTITGTLPTGVDFPEYFSKIYIETGDDLLYTGRYIFFVEFEYRNPDEVFASSQGTKDSRFNYGPQVAFIKKFIIRGDSTNEVKSLRIGTSADWEDFDMQEISSNKYDVYYETTADGVTYALPSVPSGSDFLYIVHERPPLLYDSSTGVEGVDYIDCRNYTNDYLKYYIYDPIKIELRTRMSTVLQERIVELQNGPNGETVTTLLEERQRQKIEEGYADFEFFENDPVIIRDFWLTERMNYLCQKKEEVTSALEDEGNYFGAPMEPYLKHYDSDDSDFELLDYSDQVKGRARNPFGKDMSDTEDLQDINYIQAYHLQEMRWALFYSHHKQKGTPSTVEEHFGKNIDFRDAGSSIIRWDGELPELVEDEEGNRIRAPLKGSYVKVNLRGADSYICVGCNKHETWQPPYEYGKSILGDPYDPLGANVEVCPHQMAIKDIPLARPKRAIDKGGFFELTGGGTPMGGKNPDFPSLIRDEYFNRFFFVYVGANHHGANGLSYNPLPNSKFTGTMRIVPEMTKIGSIIPPKKCSGHLEICQRIYDQGGTKKEQDGKVLSKLIVDDDSYPYDLESEKTYIEQMIDADITASRWSELGMAKAFAKSGKTFLGKTGFKSIERITRAEILCVEHALYPDSGGSSCSNAKPIQDPASRADLPFFCCPYILGWTSCYGPCNYKWDIPPDMRCKYWQSPGGGDPTTSWIQEMHLFGIFFATPVHEVLENNLLAQQAGIGYPAWDINVGPSAQSRATIPVVRTDWTITDMVPGDECNPGYRGHGGRTATSVNGRESQLMDYMTIEDARTLFEFLVGAEDGVFPDGMVVPSALYNPYAVFATYGLRIHTIGAIDVSFPAFQFASASQKCGWPTGWDLSCCPARPGVPGGRTKAIGGWNHPGTIDAWVRLFTCLNGECTGHTGMNTHAPPGAFAFDYAWWTDHWWRFINGIYQEPNWS